MREVAGSSPAATTIKSITRTPSTSSQNRQDFSGFDITLPSQLSSAPKSRSGVRVTSLVDTFLFSLHWIHLLSAVLWIGTVYFFNFFLMPFVEGTRPEIRTEVFYKLVPLTLPGFRWSSLVTFLTGALIYLQRLTAAGAPVFFSWPYGLAISVGALLGTVMFLNGWFIMHPEQKVVIASATRVAQGGQPIPEAAASGRRVVLASRTNLLLSIPTVFFMGAVSHYPSIAARSAEGSLTWFWIFILVITGAIEINVLTGVHGVIKKPLDTVTGTLCGGFILTVAFYLLFQMLL